LSIEHLLGKLNEIPEDSCRIVWVNGREIGVVKFRDRVYAYENRCLHQGGPVCRGEILGKLEEVLGPDRAVRAQRFSTEELHLVCPWHGWEYNLTTGENVADRRLRLRRYPVVVRNGDVFLVV
jgi:nitrite reductase/ring-hydroxylating ferredoxin subunit